jgi:hypothetical protein
MCPVKLKSAVLRNNLKPSFSFYLGKLQTSMRRISDSC